MSIRRGRQQTAFMADNFTESIENAVTGAFCQLWSDQLTAASMVQAAGGVGGAIAAPTAGIVGFLRRNLCNQAPPPNPYPPPFQGGQCENVLYRVQVQVIETTWNVFTFCQSVPSSNETNYWGPIGNVRVRQLNGNRHIVEVFCRGDDSRPPRQQGWYGLREAIGRLDEGCSAPSLGAILVSRVDNQVDNCGNPPVVLPPISREDTTVNVNNFNWVDNSNNIVNEGDIEITFGFAYVAGDNTVAFPFELELDGDIIFGDLNQNGSVNFDIRADIGGGSRGTPANPRPTDPSVNPNVDVEPVEGVEDPETPEEDQEEGLMVGALVTVVAIEPNLSRAVTIFQEENPNIYGPRLGSINFLYQVGPTGAAWSPDIDIKNLRQVIPVPWEYGAIDVRGTPIAGVEWDIQPLYQRQSVRVFPD